MHMYDFNPSAVARDIGKVVRKPTTFLKSSSTFEQDVTTCLPFVEVVYYDRKFDNSLDDVMGQGLSKELFLCYRRIP